MQIRELTILTNDLKKTEEFYHTRLGLPVIEESNHTIKFRAGNSILVFQITDKQGLAYHFAFNIPCNKIHNALNWVNEKASIIPIHQDQLIADFKNWHAKSIYFFDNNGNILEFIARKDLKNETIKSFNSKQIISISEVGIVTSQVAGECQSLIDNYNFHYFDKQPVLENFAALGDDLGLLIIVSDHRNWYPTNIPSKRHWLKVVIEEQDRERTLVFA
jgi:extradiol dioxygenase family protein